MYHFNVTIANRYGNDVTITTNHPYAKYRFFAVRRGENYLISSTHSEMKTIYITAFDRLHLTGIQIDGKSYVKVSTSQAQDSQLSPFG